MRKIKLSSLKGLDKFQHALVEEGLPDMKRLLKSKKKALMEEARKHIFDLGPPTPPGKRTGRSNHHQLLMYHASEIQTTIDTMRDIEFYLGRFPYSQAQVAKHRHLQFHAEAFLNELYILQERLKRFLTFIERQHRRDPRLDRIKAACKVLHDGVVAAMRKGIALRGRHVHEWRLSDNNFDRLKAIGLVYMKMPSRKVQRAFEAYYESEYKRIRKWWRRWVANGTAQSQKLVDTFFDEVFKILFDAKGRLVYPSRLKF